MKMMNGLISTLIFLAAITSCSSQKKAVIGIQPLGEVKPALINEVSRGIKTMYRVDVEVLPAVKMPDEAYYPPNKRYRADILLDFLKDSVDSTYVKVLGFTVKDISTTKGKIFDWGIFGLGSLGGRACVVSTFRLGRGGVSYNYFLGRLVKVVNHELGHTFGLGHCPNRGCLMEDAKGTIKTVDRETGALCDECRKKLEYILSR